MKQLSWLAFAGVTLAAMIGAEGSGPEDPEKPHARARLIAEHTALVPGSTTYLGVSFEIDDGWHLYWDGASDTGMPVQVDAQLPDGFRAGDLLWPAPKRYIAPGDLLDYIYEGRVTLLLPVTVPVDAEPGSPVTITARLDWLECSDVCIAGGADVTVTIPVAAATDTPAKSPDSPRFEESRKRLPVPIPKDGSGITTKIAGRQLEIRADGATSLMFYPKANSVRMVDAVRDGSAKGGALSIGFEPPRPGGENRIIGVLEVVRGDAKSPEFYKIDAPVIAPR